MGRCRGASAAAYCGAIPHVHAVIPLRIPARSLNHPDFQNEWWYYTGNLKSADGRRFGFELTFLPASRQPRSHQDSAWEVRDLYLAHLALSDLDGGKVLSHVTHTNPILPPGIAGVKESRGRVWNEQLARSNGHGTDQELKAVDELFELHLTLHT